METRISEKKKIREMDATEVKEYARQLFKEAKEKGEDNETEMTLFCECRSQYRQLTGRRLLMAEIDH
jgi:hypothetical protein